MVLLLYIFVFTSLRILLGHKEEVTIVDVRDS